MNPSILQPLKKPWLLGGLAIALTVTGGTAFYTVSQRPSNSATIPTTDSLPPIVAALGRLEPAAAVIQLAPPTALENDRILELRIQEGATVKAGDIIAVLDSRDRLQDELHQAQAQVRIAEAKLAQVKAGAKSGEIVAQASQVERLQAQRQGDVVAQREAIAKLEAQWQGDRQAQLATIQRLQAALFNAQSEYQRYQKLQTAGAISQSLLDSKRLSSDTAKQQVNEAQAVLGRIDATAERQLSELQAVLTRTEQTGTSQIDEAQATLDRIAEVRPVEVQTAQAELSHAIAAQKRAETSLEKSYIRAPMAGTVLQIHAHAGEKPGDQGIIDLGQTSQMIVVAEVYQTEILKITHGQMAKITGQAFAGELSGEVYFIGQQVSPQSIQSNQPGENFDRRIIPVKIRLTPESSRKVAGLTNLQVQATIQLDPKISVSHLP